MMNNYPYPSSYAYNASAAGLGGVIRRGHCSTVIPTVGSVSLASAGGEASTSVENYCRDGISFSRAESRVAGYSVKRDGGRRHFTYADAFVSNLKIFDRLKIALMQATITSTRDIDYNEPWKELLPDRARFTLRVIYRGIEIDGEEVAPDVDFDLCHAESYANFASLAQTRDNLAFGKLLASEPSDAALYDAERVLSDPNASDETRRVAQETMAAMAIRRYAPAINAPLVTFRGKAPAHANQLRIPKFGTAVFAEAVIKPDRQRVSLLRLRFDSDWHASPPEGFAPRPLAFSPLASGSLPDDTQDEPAPTNDGDSTAEPEGDNPGGEVTVADTSTNGVPIWTKP